MKISFETLILAPKVITQYWVLIVVKIAVVDGKEVGSIQSKLLCQSILDLYIGEEPFDIQAKEDVKLNLTSLLSK